ncbi:Smr/MutS family protein, partial [bacterium]|nr:Smr/MutS family protein [bacterium]
QAEAKARAVAEAEAMIQKAGREMDAAIRDIKKEKASREAVKTAQETIAHVREEVEKTRAEVEKTLEPDRPKREPLEQVAVGDRVLIEGSEEVGTVVALQRNGKRAEVEIGGVRLWVDTQKLFAAPEAEKKRKGPRVKLEFTLETKNIAERLDLRGKYGDEAIAEVDSYLAAVAESSLRQVTLIHGKGTGALRTKIHEFLNTHPLVKGFHDGGRNNDDFGSTVVEVK